MKRTVGNSLWKISIVLLASIAFQNSALAQSFYAYTRTITIDHTKVPNTDQSSFPVLFSSTDPLLKTAANGGHVTNANGYDIIFTSDAAGTQKLNHEIESYNGSTGQFTAWVQVPTVSHTSDTVVYLWYGNSGITVSQENKTGVWDSHYQGVYHFGDGTTLSASDSTGNSNNGTNSGATAAGGQIGGAASFNGSSAYMEADSISSAIQTGSVTYSAWISLPSSYASGSALRVITRNGDASSNNDIDLTLGQYLQNVSDGQLHMEVYNGSSGAYNNGSQSTWAANTWYYVVGTYSAANGAKAYINGALDGAAQTITRGTTPYSTHFMIGGDSVLSSGFFSGNIDELRVSNTERSADWIATEYNSQSSPSTFYALGSEYPVSSASPTVTALSPNASSTVGGIAVTITGTNFASGATVTFGGTPAGNVVISNSTTITALAPAEAAGVVTVMVTDPGGLSGSLTNGFTYTSAYDTSGYGYTRAITIDHTKVPNTDQSDFPFLFNTTDASLASTSNGGHVTNTNGYDIVFTSDAAGTQKLNHEIESYNASTGQYAAWIQVPTLSHSVDTVIYLWYGNPSVAGSQENKTGVWDSHYKGVYHFGNGTTLDTGDSTSNGNNGTAQGTNTLAATGLIGGAVNFNEYQSQANHIDLGTGINTTGDFTISLWANAASDVNTGGWNAVPVVRDNGDYIITTAGDGHDWVLWPEQVQNGSYGPMLGDFNSANAVVPNTWTYIVAVFNSSTGVWSEYINGSLTGSTSGGLAIQNSSTAHLYISHPTPSFSDYDFHGLIDEARFSYTQRSADWIATEYHNQSSPGTFYAFGSEFPVTSASPTVTSVSPNNGSTAGGTEVAITGTNFLPGTTVAFGGTAAANVVVASSTTMTATTPAGSAGAVTVTVTNPSGQSGSLTNGFTYGTATSGYSYSRTITIDHTKVPNTDQSSFPVLFSSTDPLLKTAANGGHVTNANGYDIIFTSDAAGTQKLNHEIESYNGSTGQFTAWVQVPTVSHSADTVVYLWYGNSGITVSQENKAGVWDSHYQGVYHFGDGTTLSASDSTGNSNNGTNSGATAAGGQIGGAASFNGSSAYMEADSISSAIQTGSVTYSAWISLPSSYTSGSAREDITRNGDVPSDNDIDLTLGKAFINVLDGELHMEIYDGSTPVYNNGSQSTWAANTWYYVVGTYSTANGAKAYINGGLDGTAQAVTRGTTPYSTHFAIGGDSVQSAAFFSGTIDELRVSNTERSADWIATEYNSQSSPSTFYALGSEQSSGGSQVAAPAFSPAAGTYTSTQTVTITTTTTGASIRYTTDGSTPSETAGTLYSAPVTVSSTETIEAIAYASGMTDSAVASATYTISPGASISRLAPISGAVGTTVVIAGSNFGSTEGSSSVAFNGTTASVSSWTASSITVAVPSGATTGNVVVTVDGAASNGAPFAVTSAPFIATAGVMGSPRSWQAATRLTNGAILVTGGTNSSGVLQTVELYNPATQTFSAAGSMTTQRWMHSATLLNDGTVLIVGGSNATTGATLNSAEIYDPVAATFTVLSNTLNTARAGHTATLLQNGQVLIVGGIDPSNGIIQDAELYDPPSQTFIDLGDTSVPRFRHTATLLQNGQVLIAGGETDPTPTGAYDSAEIFDPVAQVFTPVLVPMITAREGHSAVLLNNGQVLITGGDDPETGSLNSAEIYNPTLGIFTQLSATMTAPRIAHAMTLLNGGKVLITGGATDSSGGSSTVLNSAELFDPTSQTFSSAGTMVADREQDSASLLNDGTVLLTGGTDGTNIFNSAELYAPSDLIGLVSITVAPSSASVGVGTQQSFTATGTFSDSSTQPLASVLWSSSSTTIAPVSNDSTDAGVAFASAQGSTTIAATAAGVSGSTTLTVTAATLSSITLSPQDSVIALGGTLQFAATGNYSDGGTQDLTSTATWSSFNGSIATVTGGGLATGALQGTTSIQASFGSLSAIADLSVGTPSLVSIAISPTTTTIPLGTTQQYQVMGTYSNGSVQDVTSLMDWSSSTSSVAGVSNIGLATTAAQGSSTITASFESLTAAATLTVSAPALASITVTPNAASIANGGSQQLTATGNYTDGSTQNLTASSTWTSSNTAAVTVNSSGLATTVAPGNSTITATTGSIVGTATLVVTSQNTGANLNTSRYQHSAVTLNNGKILVAGGVTCPTSGSCSYLSSAEIYDPGSDTFTNTGSMATARSALAVLLNTGKVLVAGGYTCDGSGNCSSLGSVELYDPTAGTFSSAGTMTQPRSGQTMTLLGNGTVLIAGGENCTSSTSCTATSSAEIYDPVAGTFTATSNSMSAARFNASAVALNSGQVLIAGGFDGTNLPATAELFDPVASQFTGAGPSLATPRFSPTATLLNNGDVLIAGGSTCASPGCPTNAAEIYDPVANAFTSVSGGMTVARFDHTATLTTNGQVYIAGGFSSCGTTCTSEASTEVFDPVAGTFSSGQPVTNALAGETGTLVVNGSALLIGGISDGVTESADQWYQPTTLTPSGLTSIAVTPTSAFLAPGQTQQFVATGTFSGGGTQKLQSVVWTSSSPATATVSNSIGNSGFVNAQAAGTTTITATAGDVGGSASVTVATLVSIAVLPASPSIYEGATQQLSATGSFSDGSMHDITTTASWTTSNSAVATVGSQGLVTGGMTAGTATITATLGSTSGTTSITVQASPATPAISSVSPTSGPAGTSVTISGSGFGSVQGSGTVWLGTNPGNVTSWSDSQITATVNSGSQSGNAQVLQNGLASNAIAFTVSTAHITTVSPSVGVPGTVVTIDGSGFGTSQGQVWLGTAPAVVHTWTDTQVVAEVAIGSVSGNTQVLQNGVMSNKVPFTVDTLQITAINPSSGAAGASVTITGTGFGSSQGTGTVVLGNTTWQVTSWTDTQITATVASGSVSGVVHVVQNNQWSNALTFKVPGGSVTLVPNMINMLVGDTHTIEALNSSGQSVTGLTWTSSNTNIVSLSTDDPPVLTAVAAGHATITAGAASADITVSATVSLPIGTVLWSNPGDGSGVGQIIPAVPSSTGVADVFAIQNDGTVAAITSDGTTAWTADVSSAVGNGWIIPDFQGGLLSFDASAQTITKLDGITGQAYPAFTPSSGTLLDSGNYSHAMVAHPDGTVFAINIQGSGSASLVGFDPVTATPKFSVPFQKSASPAPGVGGGIYENGFADPENSLIIAGDGYAYVAYTYGDSATPNATWHLRLLRVNTAGQYDDIGIQDFSISASLLPTFNVSMISNGDTGVVLSWAQGALPILEARKGPTPMVTGPQPRDSQSSFSYGLAVTNGTSVGTTFNSGLPPNGFLVPALQLQDGSFAGTLEEGTGGTSNGQVTMVGFDSGGNVRWTVPSEQPQIATDDGGVIGQSGITYDAKGSATGQVGTLGTQSWPGYTYQIGSVEQVLKHAQYVAGGYWPFRNANLSGNSTAVLNQWFPPLKSCVNNGGQCVGALQPGDFIWNAKQDLVRQLQLVTGSTTTPQEQQCASFVQSMLSGMPGGDAQGRPITIASFVGYLQHNPRFYDGSVSTLGKEYAVCGEHFARANCGGSQFSPFKIKDDFADTSMPTADTVTPSEPFKSFWQPVFTRATNLNDPNHTGFGIGIDPDMNGINIYNESNLFHEALHGMTALYDGEGGLPTALQIKPILDLCPSFR